MALIILFFGTSELLSAQHLTWSLPTAKTAPTPSKSYNFTTGSLKDLPTKPGLMEGYKGQAADYAHNIYYGENGHIEFFVIDGHIYDEKGYPIEAVKYYQYGNTEGEPIRNMEGDTVRPNTEWAVSPVPGNCDKYYLFAMVSNNSGSGQLHMVELDMGAQNPNFPNRKGKIVPVTKNGVYDRVGAKKLYSWEEVPPDPEECQNFHLAVSPKLPSGERVLFASTCDTLKTFKIKASGVVDDFSNPSGFEDHLIGEKLTGYTPDHGGQNQYRAEMELVELSGGGFRIALPSWMKTSKNQNNPRDGIHVMDLGPNGTLKEERFFEVHDVATYPSGLEFTADGERLYSTFFGISNIYYTRQKISSYTANTVHSDPNVNFQFLADTNTKVPPKEADRASNGMIELGRDGNMYFAADKAVHYLKAPDNPANSDWKDLTLTIPPGQNARPRPLPDQIDGEDPTGLFARSCACCNDYKDYDIKEYTYDGSGNANWTPNSNPWNKSVVRVEDKLVIKKNKVIIENMTFRFAPNAEVEIKPGARLTMKEGAVFTSTECECSMWKGVDIKRNAGGYDDPQTNGKLVMIQNSMIEYAEVGAQSSFQDFLWTLSGGWISAINARFKDNLIDVKLGGLFREKSNSSFYNSRFFTTAELDNKFGETPDIHMQLFDIKKLNVEACTFINEAPNTYDYPLQRGNGIEAVDTEFDVIENCQKSNFSRCPYSSNKDPNRFENLKYGVKAIASLTTRNVQIEGSKFVENWRGVYIEGTDLSSVQANTFEMGEHTDVNGNPWYEFEEAAPYGIYSQTNTRYAISGNKISTSHHTGPKGGIGIAVDNSNSSAASDQIAHMIYRNDIQFNSLNANFSYGIMASRDNDGSDQQSGGGNGGNGVEFRCNRFDQAAPQGGLFLGLPSDINKTSGYISNPQGDCDVSGTPPSNQFGTPVDNRFSTTDDVAHFLQAPGHQLSLSYEFRGTGGPPNYPEPRVRGPQVNIQDCDKQNLTNPFNYSQYCPPNELAVFDWPFPYQVISSFQEMRTRTDSLRGLIDGGDTQGLLDTIEGLGKGKSGNSPGHVKQALMGASPYLSDTVLKTAIKSDLPPGILKQILIANSPLSDAVYQEFQNATGVPPGIKKQVEQYQSGESERTALYQQIDGLIKEAKRKENRMLRHYSHQDTANAMDSLIAYLEKTMHPWNNPLLIDAYLDRGRIQKAESLVKSLIAASGSDTPLYLEVKQRAIEMLKHDQEACEEILSDSSARQEVRQIAQADDGSKTRKRRGCSHAQALLHYYNEFEATEYFDEIQPGGNKALRDKGGKGKTKEQEPKDLTFQVYPNPSDGQLVVEHELKRGKISLYDMQGRQVHQSRIEDQGRKRLDLKEAEQGLYFLRVVLNGKTVHHEKVVLR